MYINMNPIKKPKSGSLNFVRTLTDLQTPSSTVRAAPPITHEFGPFYEGRDTLRIRNGSVFASFYRGGTSRGLLINSQELAKYNQATRDSILCHAMGSPDPDGRQIDGLGGGVSSLSKVAILSQPRSKFDSIALEGGHPFPAGQDWINHDQKRVSEICDVIYRFGQVAVKQKSIDWGSTCGNMVSAAALFAIRNQMLRMNQFDLPKDGHIYKAEDNDEYVKYLQDNPRISVRVLAHDTGKVIQVHLRVGLYRDWQKRLHWLPVVDGDVSIAGVPGKSAGLVIVNPLEKKSPPLSTGNERDIVEVDGEKIEVSIVDVGLPVVFVKAESLNVPLSVFQEHPEKIDSNLDVMEKLERIRKAACDLTPSLQKIFSPPSPKICVIHQATEYTSTSGSTIPADSMDLFTRTVSTGQLHRTIPATTLSALAIARCYKNTVVSEVYDKQQSSEKEVSKEAQDLIDQCNDVAGIGQDRLRILAVGQPAGVSTASAMLSLDGEPEAIVMVRTARHILTGSVSIPSDARNNRKLLHSINNMLNNKDKHRVKRNNNE